MTGQIIYFGDPMCSWCYGFAPEITELKESYKDILSFRLVMGGLRPGGMETIGEMGNFLKHHWEEVNKRSGQPFSYEILKRADFIYDTEPACRAVVTMRQLNPEKEFEYYKKVQESFYQKGMDMNDPAVFETISEVFDLEANVFKEAFASDEMKEKTREDFVYSQQLGVRGFPTTVLDFEDNLYLLANGYMEAKNLGQTIEKVLNPQNSVDSN